MVLVLVLVVVVLVLVGILVELNPALVLFREIVPDQQLLRETEKTTKEEEVVGPHQGTQESGQRKKTGGGRASGLLG